MKKFVLFITFLLTIGITMNTIAQLTPKEVKQITEKGVFNITFINETGVEQSLFIDILTDAIDPKESSGSIASIELKPHKNEQKLLVTKPFFGKNYHQYINNGQGPELTGSTMIKIFYGTQPKSKSFTAEYKDDTLFANIDDFTVIID